MNAIKFIKDHGVEKAREVVEGAPSRANHYCADNYWSWDGIILKRSAGDGFFIHSIWGASAEWVSKAIELSDLKRLVESVDLVESCGGIENVKDENPIWDWPDEIEKRMPQAIRDHESIYGGGNE